MKSLLISIIWIAPLLLSAQQFVTLDDCYILAEKNYPSAKQFALLEEKAKSEIEVLEKERLPKLDLNAQISYQSAVIEFPIQLPNSTIDPPNKDQYRATLDANQLIYNGGSIAINKKLKTAELKTQLQQVAVNLYTLKIRINQNYFGMLLFQEQEKLLLSKMNQLQARLKEVSAGVKYGAILISSQQIIEAEMLKLEQQLSQINFDRTKALNSLSLLIAENLDSKTTLINPEIIISTENDSQRPELTLFELQQSQLEISKEIISKSTYPKLFGFAQAGYGNPGLNMLDNSFQDFYIVGLKMNWSLFDWGKTNGKKQAVNISKEIVTSEKESFLLNSTIQQKEAESDITKYETMLLKDVEIIGLREQVLKTTTSQLQNGTINSSEYIMELNHLYEAKIDEQLRKIQLSLTKANYRIVMGNFN